MSNFSDCFGDLSEREQANMKHIVTAMTNIINSELRDCRIAYPDDIRR